MDIVHRLLGLGRSLGGAVNRDAFTPRERGRFAAEIAITALDAAEEIERLRAAKAEG